MRLVIQIEVPEYSYPIDLVHLYVLVNRVLVFLRRKKKEYRAKGVLPSKVAFKSTSTEGFIELFDKNKSKFRSYKTTIKIKFFE
jgi:hypothetical protein